MAEDIFLPGKFTDLTQNDQIAQLNDVLGQMLDRLNQIDPNSIALAWLTGDVAGKVIASKGTGNSPEWDASPLLTGLTLSGLTASQFVTTDGSKNLTSTANSLTAHLSAGDPHTQYILGVGTHKITVSDTEPTNPSVGDIWIDTSP